MTVLIGNFHYWSVLGANPESAARHSVIIHDHKVFRPNFIRRR